MISTTPTTFEPTTPDTAGFRLSWMHRRLVFASVLVLIGTCTFEGPVRLLLVRLHAESLLYVRDAMALVAIATYFFTSLSFSRLKLGLIGLMLALAASAMYATAVGTQVAAVGLGLKVFVPVFLGVIFTQYFHETDQMLPAWPAIVGLVVTVVGLQWSAIHTTPWSGIDYKAAGIDIEGTRSWSIDGIDRLAGFTRSSGDAANLILLFYLLAVITCRNWFIWFLLTGLSAYGLHLTTMRSAFLGLLVIAAVSLLSRIPKTGWLMKGGILLTMIAAITAPWAGRLIIHSNSSASGEGLTSSGSMIMRLYEVWPDMLSHFHTSLDFVLGLGVGNVGMPQKIFNPNHYNPADNLPLYILALFGAGSLLFHLLFAWRVTRSENPGHVGAEALFLGLTGMVYGVGLAMNGFESIPLGLAIGLMFGLAMRSQANDWEAGYG